MFPSLASRIVALGTVVIIALSALIWLLIDASTQTRDGFRWVTHSAEVIETMGDALTELREAESGQRGFLLTHNANFAQSFEARVTGSRHAIAQVVALTADNPVQNARARELRGLVDERIAVLREPLNLARQDAFDKARAIVAGGRGHELMLTLSARAQGFLEEEHALQTVRIESAGARLYRLKQIVIIGGSIISVLILLVSLIVVRGIRRPIEILHESMAALGRGDRTQRITHDMNSREFADLAEGYNAMADMLEAAVAHQSHSELQLQIANAELSLNSQTLRSRGEVIELLGGMAHRMQAARTDDELAQVIQVFVPRVLPGLPGALYAHNNSRNLLVPVAGWGGLEPNPDGFAPDQCWALRRGQSHFVVEKGSDIVCGHIRADDPVVYHCEPLLAGGEVIGTLYLQGIIDEESGFRLTVMAENIASALVNHRLQRGLREQTIRDPLTGLFNRRYMEETLVLEIARSARSGAPLSLVMCDVDHFKRFNDEFGHDAGDVVLQAVATEMRSRFRDGDVVCRYGGEEFTIIAPGTSAEQLANRVELVRQAISEISLRHGARTLGSTSMSFGIATWQKGMDRNGSTLVQAADAALYRAKREGRNRFVLADREAA